MSWVAIISTGTFASASGAVSAAAIPVWSNSSLPRTRRQAQPRSAVVSSGTASAEQTIESSSAVRVIEQKPSARLAQAGVAALGSRRETA